MMHPSHFCTAILAIQLVASSTAAAQNHNRMHPEASAGVADPATERLFDQARAATQQYVDRNIAIAAGYRRVGGDFPSMGEHWLSPKLIVDGVFDVSRPQLLTYVIVHGHPVLTGVVYAVALQQGESPPDAFGPEAQWHEHNGTVDEEGLLPEHRHTLSAVSGTRVAFLHAWIHIPAPDGIFSAENWAIPFLRLRLPVPMHFSDDASRSLSLLSGGRDYFAMLLGSAPASVAARSFDECTRVAHSVVSKARLEERGLTADELEQLEHAWHQLVTAVADQSGAETAKRINGGQPPEA